MKLTRFQNFFIAVLAVCLTFGSNFIFFTLKAQAVASVVSAPKVETKQEQMSAEDWQRYWDQRAADLLIEQKKEAIALAFKTAVSQFLNQVAYDAGTWLGSGGEGEKPMFITEGWTSYLMNGFDTMAGNMLESVVTNWWGEPNSPGVVTFKDSGGNTLFKLDICKPDLQTQLSVAVNMGVKKPTTDSSRCKISSMVSSWNSTLSDKEKFFNLEKLFTSDEESGLGISLKMQNAAAKAYELNQQIQIMERMQDSGILPVEDDQSGKIKTPGAFVKQWFFGKYIDNVDKKETIFTGYGIADAVGTFVDSLVSSALQTLMNGLYSGSSDDNYDSLADAESSPSSRGGAAAAKIRLAKLLEPKQVVGGPYDILNKLVLCPDLNNPGPTDCVIDEKLRSAIENKKTIKQALADGDLDGKKPFGFEAAQGSIGKEPDYKNGYPYRSFVILRKYRILPVGWEIAAEYIKKYGTRTYSLAEIVGVNDSSSQYYNMADLQVYKGLVDPAWVLKAPEVYCKREGPGAKFNSSSVTAGSDSNGDGDYNDENESAPALAVNREDYCSDEQSCIIENDDGSCKYYGYCAEERNTYNFGKGSSCNPLYNSCQTFNTPEGKTISYLKNSLYSAACTNSNEIAPAAGCRQYSFGASAGGQRWNNVAASSGAGIYLNSKAKNCDASAAGCTEMIRTRPGLGSNLFPNSSFTQNLSVHNTLDSTSAFYNEYFGWSDYQGGNSIDFTAINAAEGRTDNHSIKLLPANSQGVLYFGLNYGRALGGKTFTISFYAKTSSAEASNYFSSPISVNTISNFTGRNTTYGESISFTNNGRLADLSTAWKRFAVTYKIPATDTNNYLELILRPLADSFTDASKYVLYDDIMVEELNASDAVPYTYQDYGSANQVYLKKAPDYYDCQKYNVVDETKLTSASCASAGKLWRNDINACVEGGAAACASYALSCKVSEVGCSLYTPTNGDPGIPAIVSAGDLCPAICQGYKTFLQKYTGFEGQGYLNLIANGKSCGAQEAGCDEFTNLDTVAQGGEGLEYFVSMRACEKASAAGDQKTYYTWVGSDNTGYQLKTYKLKASNISTGNGVAPCTNLVYNSYQSNSCNDPASGNLFACSASDMETNSDCREFYDEQGHIFYRLFSHVTTVSDDCHPYRRTLVGYSNDSNKTNIVSGRTAKQDCLGLSNNAVSDQDYDNQWSGIRGYWNGSECIYMAIPDQGISCNSSAAGCRQYVGNTGSNVQYKAYDTFETQANSWSAFSGAISISSESLYVGGHSLKVAAPAGGVATAQNNSIYFNNYKQHEISFLAKGAKDGNIFVKVEDVNQNKITTKYLTFSGNDWQQFSITATTTESFDATKPVKISLGSTNKNLTIFFDNFIVKAVRDNVYQIKNSWNIDASCAGMVGCEQYKDQDATNWYVKSFSSLCSSASVGCEALIDTKNSASPFKQNANPNDSNKSSKVYNNGAAVNYAVEGDSLVYLVNDPAKRCSSEAKGCTVLGLPGYLTDWTLPSTGVHYSTTTKILNPDWEFDAITTNNQICSQAQFRCDEFTGSDNQTYLFKNPYNGSATVGPTIGRACEYGVKIGQNNSEWLNYIYNSKNKDYSTKSGCPSLSSSPSYTIGYSGQPITQPNDNSGSGYAGICPTAQNNCTEFIEPTGLNGGNMVFNGNFSQTFTSGSSKYFNGWKMDGADIVSTENYLTLISGHQYKSAKVTLKANTLYTVSLSILRVLSSSNDKATTTLSISGNQLSSPDGSMEISSDQKNAKLIIAGNEAKKYSGRFYSKQDFQGELIFSVTNSISDIDDVRLAPAGIYYAKADRIDAKTCNSLVNPYDGCILFNSRDSFSLNRSNDYLKYDADNSPVAGNIQSDGYGQVSADCVNANGTQCDSNVIVKVTPDRTCNSWLYCKTAIKATDRKDDTGTFDRVKDMCLEIGLCQDIDDKGNCSQVVDVNEQLNNYNQNTAEELKTYSGYSKPGFKADEFHSIAGYLPYEQMSQFGEAAEVRNGDFEQMAAPGQPSGWYPSLEGVCAAGTPHAGFSCLNSYNCASGKTWTPNGCSGINNTGAWSEDKFKVIYDPVTLAKEGISSLSGQAVLKVNAKNRAISEPVEVYPNTDYVLTGYINTLNLNPKEATAVVAVAEFTANGERALGFCDAITSSGQCSNTNNNLYSASTEETWSRKLFNSNWDYPADSRGYYAGIYNKARQDWTPFTFKIHTSAQTSRLRIELNSWVSLDKSIEGSAYFDNIRLRPALKVDSASLLVSSCRLYPATSALACDYSSNEGVTYRGQKGYCLQHDTKNPNICLQWWPVDLLKGELTGTLAGGYSGRQPLYYCASGTAERKYEYRMAYILYDNVDQEPGSGDTCGDNYQTEKFNFDCSMGNNCQHTKICYPKGDGVVQKDNVTRRICDSKNHCVDSSNDGWYKYDGEQTLSAFSTSKASLANHSSDLITWLCGINGAYCNSDKTKLLKEPFRTEVRCDNVVQTVTSSGKNKAWSGRVYSGSEYRVPISSIAPAYSDITYSNDYPPFGSILAPNPTDNPQKWDGDKDTAGNQPIYEKVPSVSSASTDARAGTIYNCKNAETNNCDYVADATGKITFPYGYYNKPNLTVNSVDGSDIALRLIKRLFSYSYGSWLWDTAKNYYAPTTAVGIWSDPSILCPSSETTCNKTINCQRNFERPAYNKDSDNDYCALAPQVTNVKVNGEKTEAKVAALSQTVSLSFNVSIDANQWPMTAYKVDWGDGSVTAVSGVSLRDYSNSSSPIILYHTYSYYSMQTVLKSCANDSCSTTVKIQVYDNWGWCNGDLIGSGNTLNPAAGSAWGYYQNACDAAGAWQKGPKVTLTLP